VRQLRAASVGKMFQEVASGGQDRPAAASPVADWDRPGDVV